MKAIVQQELVAEAKQQGIIPTENKQQKHRMNDLSDDTAINNWSYFILFSYLYLIQGIISGIIGTMPYVYPHLPDYNTMALFGAQLMPFSFKFILAPFLQKYSIISYGKRKTWMVFGTLLGGISFIIASFVTDQKYSNLIAIFFIIAQTGMAILDIAAHAVMVKQIESKSQTSIIIGYSQVVGILIGGLILLKLTSIQFAKSVNLSHPITSPQTVILIFGIIILLPSFYIHFRFAQTGLQSEKKMDGFSFCQIISYYKVFLNTNSRYFRTCIFFLFILQGFNFFNCLYDYELVKKGFSKDMMNTLSNILVIPIVILTFFFGAWTNLFSGRLNSLIFILTATLAVDAYLRIVFPLQLWIVATTSFFTSVLDSWRFYIFAYMINDFRVHALTGMFITFLASFSNFGRQTSIHTWFCGKFTWQTCSLIGLGLQLLLIVSLPWFYGWVLAGDSEVPKEIQQQKKEKNSENQIQIAQN